MIHHRPADADPESELSSLKGREAETRLERFFKDSLRRFRRDFLDLHAAFGRGHRNVFTQHAIEHDAQVKLALDGQCFLDEQALDQAAFGSCLVRHQRHPQHFFSDGSGLGGILRDLDASAFAASARMDLRLHHHAAADFFCRSLSFIHRAGNVASGHGYSVPRQESLGLIFVNFHLDGISWRISHYNI